MTFEERLERKNARKHQGSHRGLRESKRRRHLAGGGVEKAYRHEHRGLPETRTDRGEALAPVEGEKATH